MLIIKIIIKLYCACYFIKDISDTLGMLWHTLQVIWLQSTPIPDVPIDVVEILKIECSTFLSKNYIAENFLVMSKDARCSE